MARRTPERPSEVRFGQPYQTSAQLLSPDCPDPVKLRASTGRSPNATDQSSPIGPVARRATRMRDPLTWKQQKAMITHNPADVGHRGIARPANDSFPRRKLGPGRGEANPTQHPVLLRTNPVPDLPSPADGASPPDDASPSSPPSRSAPPVPQSGQAKAHRGPEAKSGQNCRGSSTPGGREGQTPSPPPPEGPRPAPPPRAAEACAPTLPAEAAKPFHLVQSTSASTVRDRPPPLQAPRNHPTGPPISDACQSACPGNSHEISLELSA